MIKHYLRALAVAFILGTGGASAQTTYCAPLYSNGCIEGDDIDTFMLAGHGGTAISQPATGCTGGTAGYADYTSLVPVELMQGSAYSGRINSNYANQSARIWIDLDDNGAFDSSEVVAGFGPYSTPGTAFTLHVPPGADTGLHRMRVRGAYNVSASAIGPCGFFSYGEVHDYAVHIVLQPPCTGMPTVGMLAASDSAVCSGLALSLSGGSADGGGITYTLQGAPAGSTTFTTIDTNLTPGFTVESQVTATSYRVIVRCAFSGLADTSAAVTVQQRPVTECYCSPATGTALHDSPSDIQDSASILGTTFQTSAGTTTPDGYTRVPDTPAYNTATLERLVTYTYRGRLLPGYMPSEAGVWIDFDKSGTFDAPEYTPLVVGDSTVTGTLFIPDSAALGTTGMRVRLGELSGGYTTACDEFYGGETEDYTVTIAPAPSCPPPAFLSATPTDTAAIITWSATSPAPAYAVEWGSVGFIPGTGTSITTSGPAATLNGLDTFTAYDVYVRALCSAADSSMLAGPLSFQTVLRNDNAAGAIALTIGGGSALLFSNDHATQSADEPWGSCASWDGYHTVWYKFVAPPSGVVRVSTDGSASGTLTDTRVALFTASDSSDYSTFEIISCDDNNGVTGSGYMSILAASGLTPGATYYVQVDGYGAADTGTFSLQVAPLDSSMLPAAGSCTLGQQPSTGGSPYNGWITIVDNDGALLGLVRDGMTSPFGWLSVSGNHTINTGAVRLEGIADGRHYLDRNWFLNVFNVTPTASFAPASLIAAPANRSAVVFFKAAELAALQAVAPGAALPTLEVLHLQESSCYADYDSTGGKAFETLPQTGSGTSGGAHWVAFETPDFYNFYLVPGPVALATTAVLDIQAEASGTRNRIRWTNRAGGAGLNYTLERSGDGHTFQTLASIATPAAGNTWADYEDAAPIPGVNYYRIRAASTDGAVAVYSAVARVTPRAQTAQGLRVSPNPVIGGSALHIAVESGRAPGGVITLTDVSGKEVHRLMLQDGTSQIELDLSALPAGVYILRYADGARTETVRVTKR